MKIEKSFDVTFSHKFITGDIATVKLGTRKTVESVYDSADKDAVVKFETELAEDVYQQTMDDVKNLIKKNQVAKQIFRGIKDAVRAEKDEAAAEKILDQV
jgi:hypothetical protein